ncbi:MAG TPA: InlB B-repeat-containing protein, partial [Bacilli bacterium]|nr:InlB B-repeat-containing protein [Bacilli bacterium]
RSGDGIVRYDVAGNALTNGSNTTTTFESYGRYLFADTLKWVNEEWVDYILPQTYYSFTHKTAAFADLLDWWAKVVKNKNVLLYSGMGIYKVSEAVSESWQKDYKEAPNQILYSTRRKTVQGTVFYSYTALKNAFLGDVSSNSGKGMKLIKEEMFINPAVLPEIISMTPIKLPGVANLEVIKTVSGNKIVFDAVDNAKSYVVYRSDSSMTFETKQVYKLLGANDIAGKIEYLDANVSDTQYVYGVKVMSRTNTLSDGADFTMLDFSVIFTDESGNTLSTVITPYGNAAVAPLAPTRPGATFVGWSRDISAIKSDLTVSAKYSDSKLTVTFYGIDNKVLKTENVDFHESATAPSNVQEGYTFINWSIPFGDVIYDLDVHANYEINIYKVLFKDYDGTLLAELNVEYLQDAVGPLTPVRTGYTFNGWNQEITTIKANLTVVALYEADKFTITYVNDFDDSIILIKEVGYGEALTYPAPPVVRGYNFNSWTPEDSVVYADMTVHANYSIGEYNVKFVDWDGVILKEENITYKEEVIAPVNPTRANHDFISWDKEFGDVVADLVIMALYAPYTYTVKFFGPKDEVLHTEEVNYNNAALGFTAKVEGYKFVSWDTDYSQVTEDLNIHGNWEKIKGGCNSLNYINGLSMLSLGLVLFILRKRSFI